MIGESSPVGFDVHSRQAYTWAANHCGYVFIMKWAIILCLFSQFAIPALAVKRVTVDELSKLIAIDRETRDAKIAQRLQNLELTERLNTTKLTAMEAALPGPESRRALVALADQATFLAPPQAEIPNQPVPTLEEQREMTAKAVDYVKTALRRFPNLIARRDTIRFEDTPAIVRTGSLSAPAGVFIPAQPLHPVGRYSNVVSYHDGEEVDQATGAQSNGDSGKTGLNSIGEFGPILSAVFGDLPQGNLTWSRWEQGATSPVAVFGFTVPREASHYEVRFCCFNGSEFRAFAAYHGEITVNPARGTILRLTLITDLRKSDPVKKANLMVEYGPVNLAGQTFYCPSRSISVFVVPLQVNRREALPTRGTIQTTRGEVEVVVQNNGLADAPPQTLLNEVVFDQYHLFYSEAHMVTGDNAEAVRSPVASANANAVAAPSASAVPEKLPSADVAAQQSPSSAALPPVDSQAFAPPKAEEAAVAEPATTAATPAIPTPAEPATPEINVTVQQMPSVPDVAFGEAKFSLRVTTRIVDVGVSAFDRKGKPVTDLKPEDLKITDNGRLQTLRSFGRATTASAALPATAEDAQPDQYTNRIDAAGGAQSAVGTVAGNSTILLLDATNLRFEDLTRARQQILKVLGTLPASEPVGLYVRVGYGFKVLVEGTTDRKALSAALNMWVPNAQDLARAQEADMRNRQQFDTLRRPTDVGFAYASVGGSQGGAGLTVDPKTMTMGSDPGREAMTVLIGVATHLGVVPGHKNLVWIASDNVLVNWSDQSADGDAGRMSPNSLGTFSIRTQEALNNAHVSLYPLDASQLETAATDASLQNAGVDLEPAMKDMNPNFKAPPGGRSASLIRQQTHAIQPAIQDLAQSTGGRVFGRSGNVIANLNRVVEDGNAVYLLSFSPDSQPDGQYHQLNVTVPGRRDVTLHYRKGYLYSKEPATLKERFAQVLWQPYDAGEIGLTAHRTPASGGAAIKLNIAATDIGLTQQDDRWIGKLDVFLVKRDETGLRAMVKEQSLALDLRQASYERVMREGIPFEQYIDKKELSESLRIMVVDENSGRIGSITLPATTEL